MGGSYVIFCHWLKGARFGLPDFEIVEIQPIGRGTVHDLNGS